MDGIEFKKNKLEIDNMVNATCALHHHQNGHIITLMEIKIMVI